MDVYQKLHEMGLELPTAPEKGGVYSQVKLFGENLAYVSGCGPQTKDGILTGKLGRDLTLEQGQQAAKNCMLNILAVLHKNLGDLNRIKSFVKVLAFVQSDDSFYQQPQVVNGASQFLMDLFGEEIGCPARSAIGVNALPGDIAVEIEVLLELKEEFDL